MLATYQNGEADMLNDPYGLHPIALSTFRRLLVSEGAEAAIRSGTFEDFVHARALLSFLKDGKTEEACAEIDRLLGTFPEERGLGRCGGCGTNAPPRRFAYDATGLMLARDEFWMFPAIHTHDSAAPILYAVDLTCPVCSHCTGVHEARSLHEAKSAARAAWERQRGALESWDAPKSIAWHSDRAVLPQTSDLRDFANRHPWAPEWH